MARGRGFEVRTQRFNAMVRELATRTGRTMPQVVDAEVTSVLASAADKTIVAKAAQIRAAHARTKWVEIGGTKYNVAPTPIRYAKGKGGARKVRKSVGTGIRYSAATWGRVTQFREASLREKLAGIGAAASAWLEVGAQVGLRPQPRRKAILKRFTSARRTTNAQGTMRRATSGRYSIKMRNSSPLNRYARSGVALQRAINGRLGFFRNNLRVGVFKDMAAVAAKYPGLRVRA